MEPLFQAFLNRFFSDFSSVARQLRTGEELTIGLVRKALARESQEEAAVYTERCSRVFNAYSFVVKHAAAFRNLQVLQDDCGQLVVEGRLVFALYLFFGSGDLFLTKEPQLELVIDAVLHAPEGTKE